MRARRVLWCVLFFVPALYLVTLSAPPAADAGEMVTVRAKKVDGTVVEKQMENPKYGGVLVEGHASDPAIFDQSFGHLWYAPTLRLTNEGLVSGDWTKGPIGTGEASWIYASMLQAQALSTGCLAEKWEIPDNTTVIYHIRKGVHFHKKEPVNGRELDAHDVVFTHKYLWANSKSLFYKGYEYESMEARDKWTVVVKCLPKHIFAFWRASGGYSAIIPKDLIDKYGDMGDWERSCGTGPFMLTDYVKGSSATFVKNPDYWMKDPLVPHNRLPYLEGVKWLIIPDLSTRIAALRTKKLDVLRDVNWEEAGNLTKTSPGLRYTEYPTGSAPCIWMRVDKPDIPTYDKRVRHALCLAVDNQAIADHFYGGKAEILSWPKGPIPEHSDIYVPLDKLPESTRMLYEYHPERAKALLAEAGYPNGFKVQIPCSSVGESVDLLSIVKQSWAKIGVELEINALEAGAYSSIANTQPRKYDQMLMGGANMVTGSMYSYLSVGNMTNYAMVNDEYLNKMEVKVESAFPDETKQNAFFREITPYVLDLAILVQFPAPKLYNFWQPWIKNYHGEYAVGYGAFMGDFPRYVWFDEQMKAKGQS